jgi:hypothetical protein
MIEPELIPVVDALLTGLDPRIEVPVRIEALDRAMALAPQFTLGALSQILMDYHTRAEKAAGRPSGFYVDAMRTRMLGTLPDDDLLGYAVGSAAAGEHVEVRHIQVTPRTVRPRRVGEQEITVNHPGSDRWTGGDKRETEPEPTRKGTGPHGEWTVADAAREAAQQSQRRREIELMGEAGIPQGGQYPGQPQQHQAPASERLPSGIPELQGLLARLEAQRMDEAAIDSADLDDPMQARAAIAGSRALDPEQAATSGEDNDHGAFGTQPIPCGHPTSRGPCALRAGHPELPVPGTEMGHLAE